MKRAPISYFIVGLFFVFGHGARILVVFPAAAHSHFTLGFRLAKELADRRHDVTFINAYPQKEPIKNLRDISVEELKTQKDIKAVKDEFYEFGKMSYIGQLSWLTNVGCIFSENVLNNTKVRELLYSNETFDLVILEHFLNEAMAIFQHKFKCPSVILEPVPTSFFNNYMFANPSQPAYDPNLLAKYGSDMSLWQRILNVYYDIVGELFIQMKVLPKQNEVLQKVVPRAPNLRDILYNASMVLLVSHISLTHPRPLQPNIKEIGGYHVLPSKPLPKDIQEFLDSAKAGAIIFSMGSNLKSADFPQAKKEAILKVFSKLKQKILWKFETDLPGKPENVKIVNWLPQQDVLGHPNVIGFISHVDLLGMIEAVYQGVPILGLPVFLDQRKNVNDAICLGFGLGIPFPELAEENFGKAVNELINNPKYRENAKMRSRIMLDQPVKQIDEAMFWIEYVIRHKGAPHYRSPAMNLKWYQALLLDAWAVLLLAIFIVTYCICKCVNVFRSLRKQGSEKKTQ